MGNGIIGMDVSVRFVSVCVSRLGVVYAGIMRLINMREYIWRDRSRDFLPCCFTSKWMKTASSNLLFISFLQMYL